MGAYVPLYDGYEITRQASATVTGGQVVEVTGNGTVGPAGADTTDWVGVAAFDVASGDQVTVFCGGVQRPIASGSITAGALIECAAAGKVATAASPATGTVVGVALSSAADGEAVDVQFNR